jgi:CheY-like chemotaxis protein
MPSIFTILIADKNKNVREFLRREFVADGYDVKLAKDDREMVALSTEDPAPDLLICDLEIPYADGPDSLERLEDALPLLPIVVYTLLTEHANHRAVKKAAAFLEKRGNDIDDLKDTVTKVLQNYYPSRCLASSNGNNPTAMND